MVSVHECNKSIRLFRYFKGPYEADPYVVVNVSALETPITDVKEHSHDMDRSSNKNLVASLIQFE